SVVVVSMIEKEESIIRMLKMGVKAYLSKDVEPLELGAALDAVTKRGYYYTDFITGKLIHSLRHPDKDDTDVDPRIKLINDREKEFLIMACSELNSQQLRR